MLEIMLGFIVDLDTPLEKAIAAVVGAIGTICVAWWWYGDDIKDMLGSLKKGLGSNKKEVEVVVLKCRSCGHKNSEDAKHCSECGEEL